MLPPALHVRLTWEAKNLCIPKPMMAKANGRFSPTKLGLPSALFQSWLANQTPAGQNERLGCISWLSLTVPDALTSRDFYQHVVGWNAKSIETEDGEGHFASFEMQRDNEIAAAEICQYRSEHNGIPSVWLIHLPVDDLVESLRRVSEGGGEVIKEYAEAKYAVVRDPVGVYLALQAG